MLGFLLLASTAASVVPQEIHADSASLTAASRGLVREATPRLGYDIRAAVAWSDDTRLQPRLGYASPDEVLEAVELRDLLITHSLAANIVQDEIAKRKTDGSGNSAIDARQVSFSKVVQAD